MKLTERLGIRTKVIQDFVLVAGKKDSFHNRDVDEFKLSSLSCPAFIRREIQPKFYGAKN
jgi:hypothetical protein